MDDAGARAEGALHDVGDLEAADAFLRQRKGNLLALIRK